MRIAYDEVKNEANVVKHGFSLDTYEKMELAEAVITVDQRNDYGEVRKNVYAPFEGRLCVATITSRFGAIRVISFRKCNDREIKKYEKALKKHY